MPAAKLCSPEQTVKEVILLKTYLSKETTTKKSLLGEASMAEHKHPFSNQLGLSVEDYGKL